MAKAITVLFVDDEPKLRETVSDMLTQEGFEVTTAGSVPEALGQITGVKYDVLIADLNIGEPGDGFTVVSAMRRVQPDSVTMILTGYPAFQAALRAIHEQVDDFLTKPADPSVLLQSLRENLGRGRRKPARTQTERLPVIIQRHKEDVIDKWYEAVESNPEITRIRLSRDDRVDHLPELIDELLRPTDAKAEKSEHHRAAVLHGTTRREQGYAVPMLLIESQLLHRVISNCAQKNLLTVDTSNVIADLIHMHDRMQQMLRLTVQEFLHPGSKTEAA
jgi:DNA-binding response OmpR family regulator